MKYAAYIAYRQYKSSSMSMEDVMLDINLVRLSASAHYLNDSLTDVFFVDGSYLKRRNDKWEWCFPAGMVLSE